MNAVAKLIIGLIVAIAGIAWYWGDTFTPYIHTSALNALGIIIVGSAGLILILVGLFVAWIEIEDIKDMKAEKKIVEKAAEEKKPARGGRRKR